MKKQLKEEMLEAIFVQTGGRPENPKIADVCATIAVNFITTNGMLAVTKRSEVVVCGCCGNALSYITTSCEKCGTSGTIHG